MGPGAFSARQEVVQDLEAGTFTQRPERSQEKLYLILVQMPFRWPSPPASVAGEEEGCLF